ncbi:glycosyltransferase [Luteimonas sp. MC1782]|uniref:glycosyltransferase n=1 Tax=Luteimonas sp. MC1782 TaxID=2760305 RepID=UPI001600851D|nr:glycosyltransferase [Luteimonas sp. MC1782]
MTGGAAAVDVPRLEVLRYSPLHQLEPLADGAWLATGDDPYLLVELPESVRDGGALRISVELDGEHLQRPCLYLDSGSGWTESGRFELVPDGPRHWTALACVEALAGPARFDPSECAGRFRLGMLTLERVAPAALAVELLARDAAAHPESAADVLARAAAMAQSFGHRAACAWLLAGGPDRVREPPGSYARWIGLYDSPTPAELAALRCAVRALPARPLLSLLLPVSGERHELLQACIASLLEQAYPDWELLLVCDAQALSAPMRAAVDAAIAQSSRVRIVPGPADDVAAWNRALAAAGGAWIGVIEGAPVFAPHALAALAMAAAAHPGAGLVYSDCDRIDAAGRRHAPGFRPDWNPDLFLARDYIGAAVLFETALVRRAGGFRTDHAPALVGDLALRCVGLADVASVHVPMVLSHWPDGAVGEPAARAEARRAALREHLGDRVMAVDAVGDGARLRWPLPAPPPRVSIVIPTRDRVDLLRLCVESILSLTTYPDFELLVVDNGSSDAEALAYLASLDARPRVRVLRYDRPFNYSAINNFAVAQATGAVVALLNNDIEVISPDWLDEMVAHAIRPGIGAVGAMLYYPDDTIQHAGVVVGLGGVAGHVYSRQPRGSAGEDGRAMLVQDMTAVTAACLVVTRSAWDAVGGLDEALMVAFNDIDFCLRLRRAGYRNLWTPHAELYHHESASRGSEDTEDKLRRFHSEVAFMTDRWGTLLHDDPAYNPNLSLAHGAANALASPPRRGLRSWLADALAGASRAAPQ